LDIGKYTYSEVGFKEEYKSGRVETLKGGNVKMWKVGDAPLVRSVVFCQK
jgi:hypothetical protein